MLCHPRRRQSHEHLQYKSLSPYQEELLTADMNLTIDIGNTSTKWALHSEQGVVSHGYDLPEALPEGVKNVMVCASGEVGELPFEHVRLSYGTQLPIHIDYHTPASLGADRIATACGARSLFPTSSCLVVDAGTCITVDFLDAEGIYHGGAILPGLRMSLAALHEHTARLPLLSLDGVDHAPLCGRSTEESILAGTMGATMLALAGFVAAYKQKAPSLQVLLTGGDAELLQRAGATAWIHEPLLAHIGMNFILKELYAQ